MRITPHEQERLMVRVAAEAARARRARGLRLNHPEAVAVLSDWVSEAARDGRRVADLMEDGRHVLTTDDVLPGVDALVSEVQIEATFPDGTKLVTLHDPIGPGDEAVERFVPGEIVGPEDPIEINAGRPVRTLRVENAGDRPVQVGSHHHFAESNPVTTCRARVAPVSRWPTCSSSTDRPRSRPAPGCPSRRTERRAGSRWPATR
jgi:urease subunit gamma/beta